MLLHPINNASSVTRPCEPVRVNSQTRCELPGRVAMGGGGGACTAGLALFLLLPHQLDEASSASSWLTSGGASR